MKSSSPFLFPSCAALAAALCCVGDVRAQFSAESFEPHRYAAGPLAGADLWSGQDGWILLENNYPPNLNAVAVQSSVVRSGSQAVCVDAAGFAAGSFVELRRNALFGLTSGVLEIEFDFQITTSTNPSEWEVYSQPYPHPDSCYLRWWIAADGRIEYLDTAARTLVQTSTYVSKDVWHHARTVVDVVNDRTEIHLDAALVAVGAPIGVYGNFPDHGFTQIDSWNSGDDRLYVDNFTVRERTAAHGLSLTLPKLPAGERSIVDLRLAGGATLANRSYALLASLSGTTPGTPLGTTVLPLNWDGFTSLVLNDLGTPNLPGFLGTLNADGNGAAVFDTQIPVPPALVGLDVDFAYVTMSPFDAASEPVRTTVIQ